MSKQFTNEDDALLAELGVEVATKKTSAKTPRQERIVAGFEEIQLFVKQHRRVPEHGEDKDIFERLYAVRLDRLQTLDEVKELLPAIDRHGLLHNTDEAALRTSVSLDDDELLRLLTDEVNAQSTDGSITDLRHVRSRAEIRAAEEIAQRDPCLDFDRFQPLFELTERELKNGVRQTLTFGKDTSIEVGNFFILGGQLVYVAEVGEAIKAPNGDNDARLRVIYSNKTESNLLLRSLQRALYKDEAGRRVTEPDAGPLFSDTWQEDDIESGTIYVLRSQSDHPLVAEHRDLIHKIGVTGGKVETRIANAKHDATYLLADVKVVATYKLGNINRTKLENLFHRLLAPAQIDLTIEDRFGHPVKPREWFLVPLHVIDEAVQRIRDGSIADMVYDPKSAQLAHLKGGT